MTKQEAIRFCEFFDELSQQLATAGCNDNLMPNTPENRKFLFESQRWGSCEADAIEDLKRHEDESDKDICAMDFVVFGYLAHLFKKHFNIEEAPVT